MAIPSYSPARTLEAAVLDVIRHIPEDHLPVPVDRWTVAFGQDNTGDPSFFIRALLDVESIPPGTLSEMTRILLDVLDESGILPGAWPVLSLRTVGEPEPDLDDEGE